MVLCGPTAVRLKVAGYPQPDLPPEFKKAIKRGEIEPSVAYKPLTDELLKAIPIDCFDMIDFSNGNANWVEVHLWCDDNHQASFKNENRNLNEALAESWMWLKEQGFIKDVQREVKNG